MEEDSWVDSSGSGAHDESVKRRESHGGGEAFSVDDGTKTGTISEVCGEYFLRKFVVME